MTPIADLAALEALYGPPVPASLTKVVQQITPAYGRWITASRLVMVSTVGPEGTDCSPRGDVGPVVRIADARTLLLPDWQGNNRIDSLRNIVRDGRVSLLFMVPGENNVVRVNGQAIVTADAQVLESFTQNRKHPRSVIVVTVQEAYFQCAKALMRSQTWDTGAMRTAVPTAGEMLREQDGTFDAVDYDDNYVARAQDRMW
ncbi:pyridoxamine 5'-phosphate oxidase family protein [Loktanella salsilacus]|jgi:PPOX class probable FMN-dependent enzyme|uniref:pyridoxamine 5'-phosphate oxidase family protein n=1 Tax=Loktanella salsilacus TaxID=195913 RepID=UPI0030036AD0